MADFDSVTPLLRFDSDDQDISFQVAQDVTDNICYGLSQDESSESGFLRIVSFSVPSQLICLEASHSEFDDPGVKPVEGVFFGVVGWANEWHRRFEAVGLVESNTRRKCLCKRM